MGWSSRYAFKSYVRSSNWIVPVIALVLQQVMFRGSLAIEGYMMWLPAWPMDPLGTQAALEAIISLILSFIVFTYGSMLVAIQIASSQLTPRIIATTLLRNNVIRFAMGYFIFTLLFAIGTVGRIESSLPQLTIWISSLLGLSSLVIFLYLIDHSARLLRPVSMVWQVANQGFDVIDDVFPDPADEGDEAASRQLEMGMAERVVLHTQVSAIVLAVNVEAILREAQRADGIVRIAASTGDFVATGQPLYLLYGGAATIDDTRLMDAIAYGRERTIEQDSTFAFRVIVDIAIKALSKAINDPTTAVVAIDQLHRLLRRVGERNLHNEYITDSSGKLRVIFPTPNWEDFVELTFREIRLYGAENFQIARRLHAMLASLEGTLPEPRRPALRKERQLLDRMIEKVYLLEEDAALARVPDTQGLGGPLHGRVGIEMTTPPDTAAR